MPDPLHILLVEDNEADIELTTAALREALVHSQVHLVDNGEAAIAFLKRTGDHNQAPRPDLVLLDLNLPKVDGFQVLAEMKADPTLTNIPVVVTSGSHRAADQLRAYDLQVAAYIVKPTDLDQYFAAIRAIKELWFLAPPDA
jgi:CheY-like chemotaxis protein